MTITRTWLGAGALSGLMLLTGCAETAFQDLVGLGKTAPDETKVRTVQPLSVPPDLSLPPPSDTPRMADAGSSAQARGASLAAPDTQAPGAADVRPGAAANAGSARPATTGESGFYKIYTRHGISLYKPDGTRKKISELNRELAQKIKEEKRRKNPHYGTIFNAGALLK